MRERQRQGEEGRGKLVSPREQELHTAHSAARTCCVPSQMGSSSPDEVKPEHRSAPPFAQRVSGASVQRLSCPSCHWYSQL